MNAAAIELQVVVWFVTVDSIKQKSAFGQTRDKSLSCVLGVEVEAEVLCFLLISRTRLQSSKQF